MTTKLYTNLVEMFKPDMYLALCDGDTDIESSKKRISHAVEKSNRILDASLDCHGESEILKNIPVLGAVEGGHCLPAREKSIKHLIDKPLFGYVIDGLHKNGPLVADLDISALEPTTKHSLVSIKQKPILLIEKKE